MRYFFHSETDTRYSDLDGMDFDDPAQARAEAIKLCGEMIHEAPKGFWGSRPWSVTVTDEAGLVLWSIAIDAFSSPAAEALG